jgi:Cu(I)/Ag(I) efflux system membrane fusion protein
MKKWMSYMKKNHRSLLLVFLSGIVVGWIIFRPARTSSVAPESAAQEIRNDHSGEQHTVWTCSMHPQIRQDGPGKCPICGMDLVPLQSVAVHTGNTDPNAVHLTNAAIKLAEVETERVSRDRPTGTFYLQGNIQPDERKDAELTARFGGRIETLWVNFTGQHVDLGEPLATLYSPDLMAAQRELLEAARFRETRPALYDAARTKLKLWDLSDSQIASIEQKGEPDPYFEIRSPIQGTVMKRYVATGDYVKEGSSLFRVTDLSSVWVMLDAYESDLPWIGRGDHAELTIPSVPGKNFSGKVAFIDPFIDPVTRVAKVRIEIGNPGEQLKPEMLVNGRIQSRIAGQTHALLIPVSAVLWTGKRSVVYVRIPDAEPPSFVYREITLGPRAGDRYIVTDGLEEGEEIAMNGVFRIDAAAQLEGKPSMMSLKESSTSFKVAGNCEMCKDRIEAAARSVPGVVDARWDMENGILNLEYRKGVALTEIHQAIAASGHDTELVQASDSVYGSLPECCLYERLSYE